MVRKGSRFVFIQFSAIFILLLFSPWRSLSWSTIFYVSASVLGFWAIWTIRKSKFSIFPELEQGASLVQNGPYRFVRHPMYFAILLFFIPCIAHAESFLPWVVYGLLAINLFFKMQYEEELLRKEFDEYKQYAEHTYYIIPFIY